MAKTRDVFILIGSCAMSFAIGAFIGKHITGPAIDRILRPEE